MFKTLFKDKNKTLEELDAKIAKKEAVLTSICNNIIAKETDLNTLETKLKALNTQVDEARVAIVRDCKASVDWEAMQAFSIERIVSSNHGVPVTSIGYKNGNTIREWVLFVNIEIHNTLVDEFNEYVNKKAIV